MPDTTTSAFPRVSSVHLAGELVRNAIFEAQSFFFNFCIRGCSLGSGPCRGQNVQLSWAPPRDRFRFTGPVRKVVLDLRNPGKPGSEKLDFWVGFF